MSPEPSWGSAFPGARAGNNNQMRPTKAPKRGISFSLDPDLSWMSSTFRIAIPRARADWNVSAHYIASQFLAFLAMAMFGPTIADEATAYKAFKR